MHTRRITVALPLLGLCAFGCSSLSGGRAGLPDRWRTMASAGGRSAPIEAGPPGRSVTAQLEEPEARSRAEGKVSGRVVDERGRPVPNAAVRLADGSLRAGRDLRDTTDEAGGFTIKGLRSGGSYTLIADGDDGRGPVSGRARVKAPSTGVRIRLTEAGGDEENESEAEETPQNPPRSRVGKTANRSITDEGEDDGPPTRATAPRINESDLPPAVEADALPPAAERRPARTAWKRGGTDDPSVEMVDAATDPLARSPRSAETPSPSPAPLAEDDGPNPLPPAKERPAEVAIPAASPPPGKPTPEPVPSEPKPAEPVKSPELAPDPGPSASPAPVIDPPSPSPSPAASPPPAENEPASTPVDLPTEPRPVPPTSESEPGDLAPPPGPAPATDTPDANPPQPGPTTASAAIPAETAPRHRPTWRELTEQSAATKSASASALSTRRRSASEIVADSASGAASRPNRGVFGLFGDRNRAATAEDAAAPSVIAASCQFDPKRQRIVDFRLPDLDGKPVRFQELDSDYVLIDFWGTWCKPCRESIPHLIELQTRYGPRTLRVVGVATEHGAPPEQAVRNVDSVSKSLGVNYPVLLSEADGKPCPLQEALHIQAYPTMILVDRAGTILWRGTGAELPTLSRLDRVLASRADSAVIRR